MQREHDADIVDRARAGSVDAFEEIVMHYQPRLTRYLRVRGFSRHDADDIVQQAMISAWQHLHSYNPRWRFSTWLYTIAQRSIRNTADSVSNDGDQGEIADDRDPFDALLTDNLWSLARAELAPEPFTALWLHHGEGFEGREIARIMKRSHAWVRVTLHRARNRLKQVFDNGDST